MESKKRGPYKKRVVCSTPEEIIKAAKTHANMPSGEGTGFYLQEDEIGPFGTPIQRVKIKPVSELPDRSLAALAGKRLGDGDMTGFAEVEAEMIKRKKAVADAERSYEQSQLPIDKQIILAMSDIEAAKQRLRDLMKQYLTT